MPSMFDILDVGSLRVGILRDLHVRSQRLEDLEVSLAARPHSMHGRQKVLVVDGCSVSGGAGLPMITSSSRQLGVWDHAWVTQGHLLLGLDWFLPPSPSLACWLLPAYVVADLV